MKMLIITILMLIAVTGTAAEPWNLSGDIYLGGSGKYTMKSDFSGIEDNETSFFGEGSSSLSFDNGYWYGNFTADMNRDDFYNEASGKLSMALVDPSFGNYRTYISYKNKNDITDSDNDNGTASFYFEGMKYFNETFSVDAVSQYSQTKYKDLKNELYDYSTLTNSIGFVFSDYSLTVSTENQTYDTGSSIPDFSSYEIAAAANIYSEKFVSGSSVSYENKTYGFFTSDYRSYRYYEIATRTGYRAAAYCIPYLLFSYSSQSEDAFEGEIGNYSLWKAGAEIDAFAFPVVLTAQIGRQEYDMVSTSGNRLNKNIYSADINWSYWTNSLSFYIANQWEMQKVEDIAETDYPEAKNSNYVNTILVTAEYDWTDTISTSADFGFEVKKYFIEDELNANYFQYTGKLSVDYSLSFRYSLHVETGMTVNNFETFVENDTREINAKSYVRYYF